MKKFLILFFSVTCFLNTIDAQYGFSVGYKTINASDWENLFNNYNIDGSSNRLSPLREGTAFGIDRWFRLKNYRIEFTPQLMYSRYARQWTDDQKVDYSITSNFYSFSFNTNFYALDLEGDCNCPTFSKDGNFFSKGFFFQVAPEVFYMHNRFNVEDTDERANEIGFGIGIGAGLDIGLSEFMTLTPFVRYSYYPNVEWSDLNVLLDRNDLPDPQTADNNTSDMIQIYFGIRMGFRFDELNKYGYR